MKASIATDRASGPATLSTATQLTTLRARDDPVLGYKIRVLLHDLRNTAKDPSSARRLNTTTDEHYISLPYFQPEEVALVKAALVGVDLDDWLDPSTSDYTDNMAENLQTTDAQSSKSLSSRLRNQALDAAIRTILGNFLEKRKASGDSRPCGPHHLAPVYAALFGLDMAKLQDQRFLSRLRRTGI
ncbi:hypothetical protein LZ30DRAFT_581938 [Colletotrichum cereale]|nr:hypothetical protein LZ30DRAFT_581938 [Colletotrichum cereale]